MFSRLLGGVAWLAVVIVFVVATYWAGQPDRERSAVDRRWSALKKTTFNRVMLVDVEAVQVNEAKAIAAEVVAEARGRYDEVLIYVRKRGLGTRAAERRVQWTPAAGYVELDLVP